MAPKSPKPPLALPCAVIRELDRRAIEDYRIPSLILMENAGQAAFEALRTFMSERALREMVVCAGRGNNAGDGFVVARHAELAGMPVQVLLAEGDDRFSPDAAINHAPLPLMGVPVRALESDEVEGYLAQLPASTLIVDALLGSGLRGAPREPYAAWIRAMNAAASAIVALDIPSGLDADSGLVPGACVKASLTLTFAAAKIGLFREAGEAVAGSVSVLPISIPRKLLDEAYLEHGVAI